MWLAMIGVSAVVTLLIVSSALNLHFALGFGPLEHLHVPVAVLIPIAGVCILLITHRRRFLVEHIVKLGSWSAVTVASVIGLCLLLPMGAGSFMR